MVARGCPIVTSLDGRYCDAYTAGGGWLFIQKRQDGSENFRRKWEDYKNGFGSLTGEFWYGLSAIHCLTNQGQWELHIDYTFTNGPKGYLSYSNCSVGPATEQYPLTISGFDGVTDDPFEKDSLNGASFQPMTEIMIHGITAVLCAMTMEDGGLELVLQLV
ncbi:fibrinogen C domain-containing protein 1-like [Dysidea avara]|uniref:fibrinogen C domain-containing protein 1-like n=1 Tax=Dysidea avara TaxID=196820 RepID=UPI003316AA98